MRELKKFTSIFPILIGDYKDFSALWYKNVGATLCVTLSINVMSPGGKAGIPFMWWLLRWRDRGYRCSLKKDRQKAGDDMCNTRKLL